ncbi:hypothetical protein MMC07_004074 [Pseudocyphellaria aurata]|nr:hypothetical protein [Pseudocyphellaria aurata]
MCDQDVFAVLIPSDETSQAREAFSLVENAHCFHKATGSIPDKPTISSRDPTPAPGSPSESLKYDSIDHIVLSFNEKPKDILKGWQFGTNPDSSDVLLGHRGATGISGRHFLITITEKFCVELQEDSQYGTAVRYDGQAENEIRKKTTWLLASEPGKPRDFETITICVPHKKACVFTIEFPNHEAGQFEYRAALQRFCEERQKALPPVSALGLISDRTTAAPSKPVSPPGQPIYLKLNEQSLGSGTFGEVYKVFRARDGQVFAAKKFFPPDQSDEHKEKKIKLDKEDWLNSIKNEVAIMSIDPHVGLTLSYFTLGLTVSQPNVMSVEHFQETPYPVLYMPYYPLGSLGQMKNISKAQYVSAFRQILLGLRHLHEHKIAHRDLKPANLLVAEPFTIVIADFGLSKAITDSHLLRTFCGSPRYIAPEVPHRKIHAYGQKVDIWSTGVMILIFIYGSPTPPSTRRVSHWSPRWNKHWSEILVEKVNDLEDEDLVAEILVHMVRIKSEERLTADECLKKGCEIGLFRRRDDGKTIHIEDAPEKDAGEVKTSDNDATEVDTGTATPTKA